MRADKTPSFKQLLANPVQMLAFGFGSGLSKKAPGTMGTLVAIPFYYVLIKFFENGYAAALILVVVSSGARAYGLPSRIFHPPKHT